MTTKQLPGRTAVVTGASRGIGRHIARALSQAGVKLALVARSQDAIAQLASELGSHGAGAVAIAADLSDLDGLGALVAQAEQVLGGIDILINNAGTDGIRAFSAEAERDTEHMVRLNLLAPMLLTRKVLPNMLARKTGHIVNIASLAGKGAMPFSVSYAATKAGLLGFTHSLRAELRGSGVSASVVAPGFVHGEGMWGKQERAHGVQVSRWLGTSTPEQVAQAVLSVLHRDRAEIMVNPGPIRLIQALNQLVPDSMAFVQSRFLGVDDMLRRVALADTGATASPRQAPEH